MAISFDEFVKRMIASGKRVVITESSNGKVIKKTVYHHGKKVSEVDNSERSHSHHSHNSSNSSPKVIQQVHTSTGTAQVVEENGKRYLTSDGYKVEIVGRGSGAYNNAALLLDALKSGKNVEHAKQTYSKWVNKAKEEQVRDYVTAVKVNYEHYRRKGYSHEEALKKAQEYTEKNYLSKEKILSQPEVKREYNVQVIESREVYGLAHPVKKEPVVNLQVIKTPVKSQSIPKLSVNNLTPGTQTIKIDNSQKYAENLMKTAHFEDLFAPTITPKTTADEINEKIWTIQEKYKPKDKLKEVTDKIKSITQKATKKASKIDPFYSPLAINFAGGLASGSMKAGYDIGKTITHPISTGKDILNTIFRPISSTKNAISQINNLGKEFGEALQSNPNKASFMAGELTGYGYVTKKAFDIGGKSIQKLSDLFKKQKITITMKEKHVLPHTQEYKVASTEGHLVSRMDVKPLFSQELEPKKYAVVKIVEKQINPTSPMSAEQVTKIRYELLSKSQLKSLLRKARKGKLVQPSKYMKREYSLIGYTDTPKLEGLKPEIKMDNIISKGAIRSPYIPDIDDINKKLLSHNKKSASLLKKGVYFTEKKFTIEYPSKLKKIFSEWFSKVKTKKSNLINSLKTRKRLSTLNKKLTESGARSKLVLLQKEVPLQISFKGLTKVVGKTSKVTEVPTKLSSSLASLGKFISKSSHISKFSGIFRLNNSNKSVSLPKFSLIPKSNQKLISSQKQSVNIKQSVDQLSKSIQLGKSIIKPISIGKQSEKITLKGITLPKISLKDLLNTKTKTNTKTSIRSTSKSIPLIKTLTKTTPKSSGFMSSSLTSTSKSLKLFWHSKGKHSKKSSSKSKSFKKWLKFNPWIKVKKVKL